MFERHRCMRYVAQVVKSDTSRLCSFSFKCCTSLCCGTEFILATCQADRSPFILFTLCEIIQWARSSGHANWHCSTEDNGALLIYHQLSINSPDRIQSLISNDSPDSGKHLKNYIQHTEEHEGCHFEKRGHRAGQKTNCKKFIVTDC